MPKLSPADDNGTDDAGLSYTDEEASAIEADPISITLAGHTCVGKTEWLTSLLKKPVGERSPEPDTTKWQEPAIVTLREDRDKPYIKIYDVPGQQFSGEILDKAKQEFGPYPTAAQMKSFIMQYSDAEDDHTADFRLLDHYRSCDIILFLADCKTSPMVKNLDEFCLVRRLGRPVIGVLNFTDTCHVNARHKHISEWREALYMEGAKEVLVLDAFNMDPSAIKDLGKTLASLLANNPLKRKFMELYWQWGILDPIQNTLLDVCVIMAEFLLNVATYTLRQRVSRGDNELALKRTLERETRMTIAKHADELAEHIKGCFRFEHPGIVDPETVSLNGTDTVARSGPGLFGGSITQRLPKSAGRGAAMGAVVGGVLAGVLSGGLGAPEGVVIGAAVGASLDAGLSLKLRKTKYGMLGIVLEMQVAERSLKAMNTFWLSLIDALRRRGYGCKYPLDLRASSKHLPSLEPLLDALAKIRKQSKWCRWIYPNVESKSRAKTLDSLRGLLMNLLENAASTDMAPTIIETFKEAASERSAKLWRDMRRHIADRWGSRREGKRKA